MNTVINIFPVLPCLGKNTRSTLSRICAMIVPMLLLSGMIACGGGSNSGDLGIEDANTISPPPARFSFRAQDDPVGFVPDATTQVPNPPVSTYNPDGTRSDCPAETTTGASHTYPGITGPAATVSFVRKQLNASNEGCASGIAFPSPDSTVYPVYSSVPQHMTIAYGYANAPAYFDPSQVDNWKNGTVVPTGAINCGLSTATASGISKTGDNSAVLIATNSNSMCSSYSKSYVPYLPNTKSSNGNADLDHVGLTENVVWNTDEYFQVGDDQNFYPAPKHLFQNGWAFDPRNVGQDIVWNSLNNIAANGPPQTLLQTAPSQGNALLWTMQGKYWCNNPLSCSSTTYTKITTLLAQNVEYPFPNPTPWLKNGAFVPYQPAPGFQCNLVREFTPSGAFTIVNNSSGLFVRNDGSVEFPLDRNSKPYPAVIQTWDGKQQFVVLNRTTGAVTGTNDSYPGDEVYYLGNTVLPNQAGVITHWAYYPWISLSTTGQFKPNYLNGSVQHLFDQRASDGWLGMKDDMPEDVLAWNNGTQVGQIDTVLIGGQARKPYMFGAGEQFGSIPQVPQNKNTPFPPANVDVRHIVQTEHSNSFHLWRVSNADGAAMQQNKMYKTSLYMTDLSGNYTWIASLTWTFQNNWGFADDTQPVIWSSGKTDGYGAWVQGLEINPVIANGSNLPPGWVWNPNADNNGLGSLQFPSGNVSIKAIESTWLSGSIDWNNQVSWNQGGPGEGTVPRSNQSGSNAIRFQIVGNAGDTNTKFVLALDNVTSPGDYTKQ